MEEETRDEAETAEEEKQPDAAAVEDKLAVLFPDVDLEVSDPDTGEAVMLTVREFRFLEGLEAQALARPLIAALAALTDAEGEIPGAAALDAVVGEHADVWLALTARACGCPVNWLERLTDRDARALQGAMWGGRTALFLSAASRPRPRRGRTRRACSARSRPRRARPGRPWRRTPSALRPADVAANQAVLGARRAPARRGPRVGPYPMMRPSRYRATKSTTRLHAVPKATRSRNDMGEV